MAQAPAGGRAWRGVMRRWFRRARWRKRRLRAVIGEGFLGLQGLRVPQLNPIGIWISSVIGNRLIPARDFFLEKKQKRARCSGLPSRFILCRTCRAKAACLGGVSVCIPRATGTACPSRTVRHIGTRLWPCACAHRGRVPRGAMARGGQQMRRLGGCGSRFAPAGGRGWRTLCGGGFGGRGGAARRLRAAVEGALRGREA